MKYLAFDIECADGGKGTVCSFGYVIADECFRVLERDDLVINPQGAFYLTGRKNRPDVELAYPKERFRRAPAFPHFYKRIKALTENEEYCVVGHSVSDDVVYLNKACRRYKLPPLCFRFFDTQRFFCEVTGERRQVSLANAIERLEIAAEIRYHRSDEDALATLLILQKLLEMRGTTYSEYLASSNRCSGKTADYAWNWDSLPDRSAKKAAEDRRNLLRPEKGENLMTRGRRNYTLFLRYLQYGEGVGEPNDRLKGKKISISMNYEREHFREMIRLAGLVKAAGGEYVMKASEVDIFATFDALAEDGSLRRCARGEYVREAIEGGAKIEVIRLEELLALLGTTREALEAAAPTVDVAYLADPQYGKDSIA